MRSDSGDVRSPRVGESALLGDASTTELEASVGEETMMSTISGAGVDVYSPGAPVRRRSPQPAVGRPHRYFGSFWSPQFVGHSDQGIWVSYVSQEGLYSQNRTDDSCLAHTNLLGVVTCGIHLFKAMPLRTD